MDESVGKKLSKARLKRGLSIDEAAHATRLRPDKIVALENDDYSLFASNVYAKGFLQIYGRFLDVDVADFASTLEGMGSISIEDYQYLNSGAPPRREERASAPIRIERRGPGIGAVLLFVLLVGALAFGFLFYVNWQRIEPVAKKGPASPTPAALEGGTPAPAGKIAATTTAATPTPVLRPVVQVPAVTDRDFVAPPALAPAAPTGTTNEVQVLPLRKTWIIVRKDDPNSPPIFEDFLYPDSPPLKLKGTRFFIEARDPSAIQIRKNGAPMAYQAPGVAVQ
jgi:cytoskeletal protein RodZ